MEITLRQAAKTWTCAGLLTSDKKNNPGAYVKSADRVYKHIYGVPGEKLMTRIYNSKGVVDFINVLNNTVGYNSFKLLVETREYSDVIRELIEMQERSRKIESNYKARMRKFKKLKKKAAKQRAIISASSTTELQKKEASEKLRDIESSMRSYKKKFNKDSKESNKIYNLYKKTLKVLRKVTGIQKVKNVKTSTSACKNLIKRATDPFESMGYDDMWNNIGMAMGGKDYPNMSDYWDQNGLDVDSYNRDMYSSQMRPENDHLRDKVTIADNPQYGSTQQFSRKQQTTARPMQQDDDSARLAAENRYLKQQLAKYQQAEEDDDDSDDLSPEELMRGAQSFDDVVEEVKENENKPFVATKPIKAKIADDSDEDEDDDDCEELDGIKDAIRTLADNQDQMTELFTKVASAINRINNRISSIEGNCDVGASDKNPEPVEKKIPMEPVGLEDQAPSESMTIRSDEPEIRKHTEEVKNLPIIEYDQETHMPLKPSEIYAIRVTNADIEAQQKALKQAVKFNRTADITKITRKIEQLKREEAARQNAALMDRYNEELALWKKNHPDQ